jgi:hypothetical protein
MEILNVYSEAVDEEQSTQQPKIRAKGQTMIYIDMVCWIYILSIFTVSQSVNFILQTIECSRCSVGVSIYKH